MSPDGAALIQLWKEKRLPWPFSEEAAAETHIAPLRFVAARGLAEAHANTAAVLRNKFDAARLETPLHHVERGPTRLMTAGLQLANGHHTDASLFRKLLLAPIQQTSSRSTLGR